jgi:PAS domain S-box-containing protein
MLQGKESSQGQIVSVQEPDVRKDLHHLVSQREDFQDILKERWAERPTQPGFPVLSSRQMVQYRFVQLAQATDVLQDRLHAEIENELYSFPVRQYVFVGLFIVVLSLVSIGMSWRFFRERNKARKEAEKQRKKLHERRMALRSLFNNAPIGIFRTTSDGRILEANPAIRKMLRVQTQEQARMYAQNLENMLYADGEQRSALLRRLNAEEQVEQYEIQCQRADKTLAWFSLNARVNERQGDESFMIDGFMFDITSQKQTQENIEHLNRVLYAIREINHLIISEKDRSRLIRRGCQILVQSSDFEAAMIILTDRNLYPVMCAQEGLSDAFDAFDHTLTQGLLPPCCQQAMSKNKVCLIKKSYPTCADCPLSKDCVHCDTLCIVLQHMEAVYGFLTVALPKGQGSNPEEQSILCELASDIAFALHGLEREEEVKKAEEAKKKAEKQLTQAQKMEAIGRLAGGVAHDFNNMLGVILGYADMGLARIDMQNPLYHFLEQIRQAAERSANLTKQLLAFSRRQLSQPKVLDLNAEIENQRHMLDRLIGENVDLQFYPAFDLWPIQIDPSQVDQILANLIINAREAIANVGTITLETMNVTLDQAYADTNTYVVPGDYTCLMVSDTGTGMEWETMDQIFDPFFSTKPADQGTGLGLSTVYGIVKQNRGFIHVYSEPDQGSTFKLYFPRIEDGGSTHTDSGQKSEFIPGSETVLLVEDEEMVLELTQAILEGQGYTVLPARSSKKAQDIARDYPGHIHILLTDVILPEMNGKELKALLEMIRPEIKTLFMSGYTENVIAQQGIVDSQVHFIQKPFSSAGLNQKIRELMSS